METLTSRRGYVCSNTTSNRHCSGVEDLSADFALFPFVCKNNANDDTSTHHKPNDTAHVQPVQSKTIQVNQRRYCCLYMYVSGAILGVVLYTHVHLVSHT